MFLAAKRNAPIRRLVLNDVGAFIPWGALLRMKGSITRGLRFSNLEEVEAYVRKVCDSFGPLTDEQWRHLATHSVAQEEKGITCCAMTRRSAKATTATSTARCRLAPTCCAASTSGTSGQAQVSHAGAARAKSEVLPASTLKEMRQRRPDTVTVEFKGVGHVPALMSEDQIARSGNSFCSNENALVRRAFRARVPAGPRRRSAARAAGPRAGSDGFRPVLGRLHGRASPRRALLDRVGCGRNRRRSLLLRAGQPRDCQLQLHEPRGLDAAAERRIPACGDGGPCRAGRIDPTANLAAARAWLFTGTQDRTVYPAVVIALKAYYASYRTNVKLVADMPAGHAMVVEDALASS